MNAREITKEEVFQKYKFNEFPKITGITLHNFKLEIKSKKDEGSQFCIKFS